MKKIVFALAFCASVFSAQAEFSWSWWLGDDRASSDADGVVLGIGTERRSVRGGDIALCWSKAETVRSGVLGALGYSETETLANGAQFGFVTRAESAALQFGLVCFNETGFLPVCVFFNMDTKQFGSGAKQ